MTADQHPTRDVTGLDGVVAAETRLSHVDGEKGELLIAGYALTDFALQATHEEVIFLLWHDRWPTPAEAADFQAALGMCRALPPATHSLLQAAAAAQVPAMDALRMAAATLDLDLASGSSPDVATLLVARLPVIVAAYWRLRQGLQPLNPDPTLSQAASYLHLLTGQPPHPALVRGLDTYLNTVADHGLNASTFTARVIVSTGSDLVSALTGAIGALKGPLHGGAPGPALDMVFEIGHAANAEPTLRRKLAAGERLMGFGHRVYRVRDPRAEVLQQAARRLQASRAVADFDALYTLATRVEEAAVRLLAEFKPGRRLQTNVEFYTALLLHGLGLPNELFTPTFAVGRAAGWLAHCREQQQTGRLIRPQSRYVGSRRRLAGGPR